MSYKMCICAGDKTVNVNRCSICRNSIITNDCICTLNLTDEDETCEKYDPFSREETPARFDEIMAKLGKPLKSSAAK